jgi:hypothetical protein
MIKFLIIAISLSYSSVMDTPYYNEVTEHVMVLPKNECKPMYFFNIVEDSQNTQDAGNCKMWQPKETRLTQKEVFIGSIRARNVNGEVFIRAIT